MSHDLALLAARCEHPVSSDAEEARLHALQELDLLDTPESESFDRITRMAGRLFGAPIAAVSLTDRHRQWFKSSIGTQGREIPREGAPCAEVTRSAAPLIIEDMLQDPVFSTCLLARSGIRFYAGAPLTTRQGYVLGSMCVLDQTPRRVSEDEMASLQDFASMAIAQVELEHNFGRVDPLSGLPNRNQLTEDLLDLKRRDPDGAHVLVLLDLADPKNFSRIVSVLGTAYIDSLIQASSRAIRETVGRKSGLYHVGSAAFAVLLDGNENETEAVVESLRARLKEPVVCKEIPVTINAAFGVSPFRFSDAVTGDILRTALSAAQNARDAETELSVYCRESDKANWRQVMLLTDIREALNESDQFALHYQPRIDSRTQTCIGAEALLRWHNPKMGQVSPGEFIPLVEQTALAGPVTNWVIASALRQLAVWREADFDLCISINVSAPNLEQPDFVAGLKSALEYYRIPAHSIELELTESAFIRNRTQVLAQLAQIRALGVGLAIDDFGTGYSSLSYLQKIPATTVKIDQSFIRNLHTDLRDQALVRSMIAIAHDLDYCVVAEGVETPEAHQLLTEFGCDELQGYFISRPVAVPAFTSWLQQRSYVCT